MHRSAIARATCLLLGSLLVASAMGGIACSSAPAEESSSDELNAGKTNVVTQHNDNGRTGANLRETTLTPANVNANQFGKKFALKVDGQVYAQPLFTSADSKMNRDVVFLATQNNSVFAYDANTGALVWSQTFGQAVASTQVPSVTQACGDIGDRIGITSTPVIDPSTKVMYLVAKSGTAGQMRQTIFKVDITNGKVLGQRVISGQVGSVTFDPQIQLNRASLLLSRGKVYVAFGGHCDRAAYHGWVMSYAADSLAPTGTYVDTPTGQLGGIWQAGGGLAADDAGNVYLMSGNGTFDRSVATTDDVTPTSKVMPRNLGAAYVKLTEDLHVLDFFVPSNVDLLNPYDIDVGASGPMLMPGTNLLVGGGKEGALYVLDPRNMGRFTPTDITTEAAVQRINDAYHNTLNSHFAELFAAKDAANKFDVYRGIMGTGLQAAPNVHGTPAFWRGQTGTFIYVWTEVAHLKAFRLNGARFDPNPIQNTNDDFLNTNIIQGMPGGFLSVSANGNKDGIVWATHPLKDDANAPNAVVQGILRAYNAADIRQELWNSQMNFPADSVDSFAKFVAPTVANGKVFVPTFSNVVLVYGLK
jgi:hypothetical protein